MEGSLRTFDDGLFEQMRQKLYDIARKVEEDTGCVVEIHMTEGYPAVVNPAEMFDKVQVILPVQQVEKPSLVAEDFSWYQRRVSGMFFFLGLGQTPALHADNFDFDETVLLNGVRLFETLAEQYR